MRSNSISNFLTVSNGFAGFRFRQSLYLSIMPFLVVCCSIAVPLSAQQPANTTLAAKPNRLVETIDVPVVESGNTAIRVLHEDMEVFTRRLDSAESPDQKLAAWIDLCGLYLVIVADTRYQRAETLQGYRGRIANRLQKCCKELTRDNKDQGKTESWNTTGQEKPASDQQSSFVYSPEFTSAIVDPHWDLMSHHAGAGGVVSYHASGLHGSSGHFLRGANAGEPFDNGPELVSLIEAILHPDFWNTAGGAGTLHYYRPLRILVVRATTTVHEDLADFLQRLR